MIDYLFRIRARTLHQSKYGNRIQHFKHKLINQVGSAIDAHLSAS